MQQDSFSEVALFLFHDYAACKMESPARSAARRLKEITPHPAFRRMRRGVPIRECAVDIGVIDFLLDDTLV